MTINQAILLSTAYCGPVSYYAALAGAKRVFIERHENYLKQTYRNRCLILGANGVQALTIPVINGRSPGLAITKAKIDYSTPWQRNHWRSIVSAYNNSPFFEYYADDLAPFFKNKWEYLFAYNNELMSLILNLLQLKVEIYFTSSYEYSGEECMNLRESISPKTRGGYLYGVNEFREYTQVFEQRLPFMPDLSILDLLFNTGPRAATILQ